MAAAKSPASREFLFQVAALVLSAILVHGFYVLLVRPTADNLLAEQAANMAANPDYVPQRSAWVIVRDFEQEACFILALWALSIIAYKGTRTAAGRRLLDDELVPAAEGTKILPEDAREYARQIEAMPPEPRGSLLPRALLTALNRFTATRSIQDVSETAKGVF